MAKANKKLIQSFLEESKFSSFSYLSDVDGRRKFEDSGKEHLIFYSGKTTQAFVVMENGKDFIVSFRGTEVTQIEDMLADVNFKMKPYIFGNIHEGFYLALDEVFFLIVCIIKKHWSDGAKIKVNGHSLGGALAVLFATRLKQEEGYGNIIITTFGQPRVGDEVFINQVEKMFGDDYRRVVNDLDLVPKLPPVSKLEYAHSDTLFLIDESGFVNKADASAQYFQVLKEMITDFAEKYANADKYKLGDQLKSDLKESIDDHSILNYVQQLENAVKACTKFELDAEV